MSLSQAIAAFSGVPKVWGRCVASLLELYRRSIFDPLPQNRTITVFARPVRPAADLRTELAVGVHLQLVAIEQSRPVAPRRTRQAGYGCPAGVGNFTFPCLGKITAGLRLPVNG